MNMHDWLDEQDKAITGLYEGGDSIQKQYDDREVEYDSAVFAAMERYMSGENAKATLCEKAAKADPLVVEAKKAMQEAWRSVCASRERIKYIQNRYEGEKMMTKVIEDTINEAGNMPR